MTEIYFVEDFVDWRIGSRAERNIIAYFTRRETAGQLAGPQEKEQMTRRVGVIQVFDSIEEFESQENDKLRRAAIAKLTPEERKALNLSEEEEKI